MFKDFQPVGISISAGLAPCTNHCRYCQLADRRLAHFSMDRFVAVVEKFLDYKTKTGFDIGQWLGYSFELALNDFEKQLQIYRRSGFDLKVLLLGGLVMRRGHELRQWYQQRQALGSDTVVASYYGYGSRHDYLNNQVGHFAYQIEAQKIAAEVGLKNSQRIFLFKAALPEMERILDSIDEVGDSVTERVAYLLFYSGLGRAFENERITHELLDNQPDRLKAFYRDDHEQWKSEEEWVEWVRDGKPVFPQNWLSLNLNDANITRIEQMSCEEIIDELTRRTKKAYSMIPEREELAEKYSDPTSEKLYMFMWDMECLWVDRFLARNPEVVFERDLTHFGR